MTEETFKAEAQEYYPSYPLCQSSYVYGCNKTLGKVNPIMGKMAAQLEVSIELLTNFHNLFNTHYGVDELKKIQAALDQYKALNL